MPVGQPVPQRVFLSHTSELRDHPRNRSFIAAAEAAVSRAGHVVVDMDYFAASNLGPADACRMKLESCDVYVAVVGFRYGSLVTRQPNRSYTRLEFETAGTLGLPRLVFMLSEDTYGPATMFRDVEHGGRQEEFRAELMGVGLVATVSDPHELELSVFHALVERSNGAGSAAPNVIYDSDSEKPAFASWTYFALGGVSAAKFFRDATGETTMRSVGGEVIGMEKSIPRLKAEVSLQYRITACPRFENHIYFVAIPMQANGVGRTGLIEVGATVQDDPRNPVSLHRDRHSIPRHHYFDDEWHDMTFSFDFVGLPTAFYTIFAPRLNEGAVETGDGELTIRRVRVSE